MAAETVPGGETPAPSLTRTRRRVGGELTTLAHGVAPAGPDTHREARP